MIAQNDIKHKYYRVVNQDDKIKDTSPLSMKLHSITGWHSNDYIKPVINAEGDLLTIISDESKFRDHYSVSLIIMPFLANQFLQDTENKLVDLVTLYSVDTIHFTELFGSKRILKDKRNEFLDKYIEIVKIIPMSCLSISKSKPQLLKEMGISSASDEELFFSLFWNNFERVISAFGDNNVCHIHFEQEYDLNPKKYRDIGMRLFQKLYSGINHLYDRYPQKYVSICKHPHFFSKKALLYSSLSDLIAYAGNKLQHKIDSGVPEIKIMAEYADLLKLIRNVFMNYSGLASKELVTMINNVQE